MASQRGSKSFLARKSKLAAEIQFLKAHVSIEKKLLEHLASSHKRDVALLTAAAQKELRDSSESHGKIVDELTLRTEALEAGLRERDPWNPLLSVSSSSRLKSNRAAPSEAVPSLPDTQSREPQSSEISSFEDDIQRHIDKLEMTVADQRRQAGASSQAPGPEGPSAERQRIRWAQSAGDVENESSRNTLHTTEENTQLETRNLGEENTQLESRHDLLQEIVEMFAEEHELRSGPGAQNLPAAVEATRRRSRLSLRMSQEHPADVRLRSLERSLERTSSRMEQVKRLWEELGSNEVREAVGDGDWVVSRLAEFALYESGLKNTPANSSRATIFAANRQQETGRGMRMQQSAVPTSSSRGMIGERGWFVSRGTVEGAGGGGARGGVEDTAKQGTLVGVLDAALEQASVRHRMVLEKERAVATLLSPRAC